MTHTPGPWQSIPTEKWVVLGGNQPSSVCHVGDYTIATSEPSYEFHGTDENDARLIAAAPELLEALKRIDKIGNDTSGNGLHVYGGLMTCGRLARAAIAKATGEP